MATRPATKLRSAPVGRTHLADTAAWNWQDAAACRNADLALFFGADDETDDDRRTREREAKALCEACPVRQECLVDAIERNDAYGIRGGLDADERFAARTSMRRTGRLVYTGRTWAHPDDLIGAQRRLRALALAGHGTVAVCRATGLTKSVVNGLRSGQTTRPHQRTVDAIREAYPKLLATPPQERGVRVHLLKGRSGWHSAEAWEGVDIDDPNARPREAAGRVA